MIIEENKNLVNNLIKSGVLKTPEIINAFYKIDRNDFVPEEFSLEAYEDYPIPIGFGQTISQPTTVAFMLELLSPKAGDKILDVGFGSGWTTALLSQLVGDSGKVIATEVIPELHEIGKNNLAKYNLKNIEIVLTENEVGYKKQAPYDKILVSASSAIGLPKVLADELKIHGRMIVPIANSIWQFDKLSNDELEGIEYPGFIFVPLKQ